MDSAPRPTPREATNLLVHGLRARLGRPRSHAIVVLALLAAVVCGFTAAAGGYRLAWEAAPPLPTGAEAQAITSTVLPGLKVWGGGDAPVFVPAADGDGIERGTAFYWTRHTAETKQIQHYTEGARDRLAAAGWTISKDVTPIIEPDLVTPTDESTFQATRGNLILEFNDFYWHDRASYDSDGGATFTLARARPPAGVRTGAVLGGLLGALIGWLLTGFVSRRTPAHPGAVGALWVAVLALVPNTLLALLSALFEDPTSPGFWTYYTYPFGALTVLAGLFALIAVAVAVAAGPPPGWLRAAFATRRRGAVTAAALVLAIAAGSTAATVAAGPAGPPLAGGKCAPSGPPPDPPPAQAAASRMAYVFVGTSTTDDQANLINAALFRVMGAGPGDYHRDAGASDFGKPYCGDTHLPVEVARGLPWYFIVPVSSASDYDAVVAEVTGMPGVVAVRHGW
jgi:hypothetical protein